MPPPPPPPPTVLPPWFLMMWSKIHYERIIPPVLQRKWFSWGICRRDVPSPPPPFQLTYKEVPSSSIESSWCHPMEWASFILAFFGHQKCFVLPAKLCYLNSCFCLFHSVRYSGLWQAIGVYPSGILAFIYASLSLLFRSYKRFFRQTGAWEGAKQLLTQLAAFTYSMFQVISANALFL